MLRLRFFFLFPMLALLTGCAALGQAAETTPDNVTIGVGFVPNVQFAPFYVAQSKGFYAEAGLEVQLEYGFENDFVALTATGERDFAVASGDQVLLAAAQELPLVYVMKWYERFPVGVMAKTETGINTPADLEGRQVGIPGLFGASYVAWKALAYAANLDENQINLEAIGFTQAEAIANDTVDAAVVYVVNEPVQLRQNGTEVILFDVSDYVNLVSNGLVTNPRVLEENPELVRRLVQATLRGLAYTLDNPDEAFEISRTYITDMSDADAPAQRAVLEASLPLWESNQPGLSSVADWQESMEFMVATGLLEEPVAVEPIFSNEFVTTE